MSNPRPLAPLPGSLSNVDGWTNVLTGLGRAARDKRKGAVFERDWLLTRDTLESLFHGDDMICRLCELPAKEMTREWIEIAGDPDNKIGSRLQELEARSRVCEALTWARLYGGCVIVLVVDDGRAMDQPLNLDGVKSIDDLMVIDRHDLSIAAKYANPALPKFGQPETFEIRTTAITVPGQTVTSLNARIHESRCLVFHGTLTGRRRKIENEGWAQGVVDRIYEVVRDFTASYAGAAHLLTDYAQAVFKIKGLAAMLASDQDALVIKRLQLLDLARSVARAIPLDAEGEDFDRKATPTSGLPELLDRMASRLSAATGIPLPVLMGQHPGGLNATGDDDARNWYNVIRSEQETHLRNPLALLLRVVAKAVGVDPKSKDDQVTFDFRSLWQATEAETATTRKTVAETDALYHGIGVLDAAEISVSRFGGDKYSIETTIDQELPPTNSLKNPDDLPEEEDAPDAANATKPDASAPVQDSALNGAQVTALQGMLAAIAEETLDPEAAKIAIGLAFPQFDAAKIAQMVAAQKRVEKPEPPPVIARSAPGAPNVPTTTPTEKPIERPEGKEP